MSKVININDYHMQREAKKRRALYVRQGKVTGDRPKEEVADIKASIERINEIMRKLREQK